MHIIRTAQAPRFEVPGVAFTAMAAPSRGSADICTWLLTVEPGLKSPEPHTLDADEVFMVVSGTVQLGLDAEPLGPGDAAVVPAGEPIQVCNPGAQPAEVYVAIRAGFTARTADGTPIGTPPWAQ
ncbi:cupin domain [Krasilnikovia cinnamomea]|uniref:Cupin domain n=1 Tax=Krasilnikovia cinnamomea TaxID=349313 RepID=A0A4Q7ZF46_9ACTN|nr:cupin domain-containing protein [Krasilnikovia cinnamomea]RZU49382.1 cupin domain [Krasilnikovia cinnamomea]